MWNQIIHIGLMALVFILMAVGILMTPLTLPGTWLVAGAGVLYSIFSNFDGGATSTWWVLGWLVGLATFGEIMELVVGTLGGKAVNVSNGAIIAAFVGGMLGLFIGVPVFLVGALIGLYLGAFLGAFIYELYVLGSVGKALVTAATVLTTRMMASFLKTCLAIGMAVFLGFKMF
jgi:uncharacterized protein YqgC (DUF456 family)